MSYTIAVIIPSFISKGIEHKEYTTEECNCIPGCKCGRYNDYDDDDYHCYCYVCGNSLPVKCTHKYCDSYIPSDILKKIDGVQTIKSKEETFSFKINNGDIILNKYLVQLFPLSDKLCIVFRKLDKEVMLDPKEMKSFVDELSNCFGEHTYGLNNYFGEHTLEFRIEFRIF
jgi:hypothetical protein